MVKTTVFAVCFTIIVVLLASVMLEQHRQSKTVHGYDPDKIRLELQKATDLGLFAESSNSPYDALYYSSRALGSVECLKSLSNGEQIMERLGVDVNIVYGKLHEINATALQEILRVCPEFQKQDTDLNKLSRMQQTQSIFNLGTRLAATTEAVRNMPAPPTAVHHSRASA